MSTFSGKWVRLNALPAQFQAPELRDSQQYDLVSLLTIGVVRATGNRASAARVDLTLRIPERSRAQVIAAETMKAVKDIVGFVRR